MPTGTRYTTDEVAAMLDRKPQTVSKAATRYGIGTRVTGKLRFFSDADVTKLRAICHGKPGVRPDKHKMPTPPS